MIHKLYNIAEIKNSIGARGDLADTNSSIRTLCYDSRKLTDTAHALFFAFKGRHNGHRFINEVYQAGVRNFVISEADFDRSSFKDANFLLVDNTLKALQSLAAYHRWQFTYPVIAITGSNGKTIVKEWLYQLLSPEYNIVRSPKSYNSQIGVPLSVWEMNEDHNLAIFETGISETGEMQALEKAIKPSIGILTNIGEAHNQGFKDREEKISEKLSLFKHADQFIYSPFYLQDYKGGVPGRTKFTWNQNGTADLQVYENTEITGYGRLLSARYKEEAIYIKVPFTDSASIENAICCWAAMLALGYHSEEISTRLEKLHTVKMRLELKNGIHNCSIIDDSYSLDTLSLGIALDFLNQQNQHDKRSLILSDIPQAGLSEEELYSQVAKLLDEKQVDRLIGVGEAISRNADKFQMEKQFYQATENLLKDFSNLEFEEETILLKGARSFGFERISKLLTQKVHETVLEINLNALENNLNYYKNLLKPGVKLMVMVKAFSYGSGSFEIANLLQFNKVDYIGVAYADEGVSLRNSGITMPIMVMNPDTTAFDTIIDNNLEPEIYSIRVLKDFLKVAADKKCKHYPVHIKIDTGMHRLGFMLNELDELLGILIKNELILIKSVFSHMVGSEDAALDGFSKRQIEDFRYVSSKIESALGYPFLKHLSNTSGISRWPDAQFDMVRLGIGLYGFDGSLKKNSPLAVVTTLKTIISQIKELDAGETVGYNRKGVLPYGGKIATVKLGYADGYSRKLGNGKGKMLINGHIVPTIGNICMDMCMLDITGIDVSEGDEVIVFNEVIRVEDLAQQTETISYEVLTGISQRVKRIYYYE